jgi:hypothetical protein
MQTGNTQTDMTNLITAFRNFVNVPNNKATVNLGTITVFSHYMKYMFSLQLFSAIELVTMVLYKFYSHTTLKMNTN